MSDNPNSTLNHLAQIANALQTKLPPGTVSLKVSGVATPVAQVAASVQSDLTLFTEARDARLDERRKVATRDAAKAAVHARIASLHKALEMELGETNPVLADFGFRPLQKKRTLTPEEKAAKAAKAKATRAKNGTLGRRQKRALDVKPEVPPSGGASHA